MNNTFIYNYFFQDESCFDQYLKLEDLLYFAVDFWWQNRVSSNSVEGKILYKQSAPNINIDFLRLFCFESKFKGYLFIDNIDDIKLIKRRFFEKSHFYLYCIEKDCELKGICNEPFMQLRNNYLELELLLDKYNFWEGKASLRKEDILLLKQIFEHFIETSDRYNVYPYGMKSTHNISTLMFLDLIDEFSEEKNNERFIKNYENFVKTFFKVFVPDDSVLEIYYKSVEKRGLLLGQSINEIELLKEKIAEELKNEKSYEIRKYLMLLNNQLDNYHAFLFKRYMILQKENNEVYMFIRTFQQVVSIRRGTLMAGIYGFMVFIFLISGQIFGFSNIF